MACPALFDSATVDKTKAGILLVLGKQEPASEGPAASLRGEGHNLHRVPHVSMILLNPAR